MAKTTQDLVLTNGEHKIPKELHCILDKVKQYSELPNRLEMNLRPKQSNIQSATTERMFEDPSEILDKLKSLHAQGDWDATLKLGKYYLNGYHGVQDQELGLKLLQDTASQNHSANAQAKFILGYFYKHRGCFKEAYELYQKAAEQGHVDAQYNLALLLLDDQLDSNSQIQYLKNHAMAFKLFYALNEQYPPALNCLGNCYEQGMGTPVDQRRAFLYYKAAAAYNIAEGIFNMARCHHYGLGVKRNLREARKLYLQLRDQGDTSEEVRNALLNINHHFADATVTVASVASIATKTTSSVTTSSSTTSSSSTASSTTSSVTTSGSTTSNPQQAFPGSRISLGITALARQ